MILCVKKFKDPVSGLTHLVWAVLTIPCIILLMMSAYRYATIWHVVSFAIFGVALLALYTASSVYHLLPTSPKIEKILRRVDHMMIFVLIAGTYTPICLVPLRGAWGWTLLVLIWVLAIAGIVLKALWLQAPRWLSTGLYVLMGWLVVLASYPLAKEVSSTCMGLLFAGGIVYTLGAVIYALKWPKFNFKWFGFHELFHLFVMGGSTLHVIFMFKLVF